MSEPTARSVRAVVIVKTTDSSGRRWYITGRPGQLWTQDRSKALVYTDIEKAARVIEQMNRVLWHMGGAVVTAERVAHIEGSGAAS